MSYAAEMLRQGIRRVLLSQAVLTLLTGAAFFVSLGSVAASGMSVRDTERLVARLAKGAAGKKTRRVTDRDILRLQEELAQKLGTKVVIKPGRKGRGALVIDYTSLAQLDELLAKLQR